MVKKLISGAVLSLMVFLAACGGNGEDGAQNKTDKNDAEKTTETKLVAGSPLQDGTYSLTETNFDENGWKMFITITVEDGKISDVDYNYENKEGTLKTDDKDYQNNMKEKAGVGPQEYVPRLSEQLTEKQDAKLVDIVTGATHSSEKFINYAQQLIQKAQAGDETHVEIDPGAPLKDGEYKLEEKNFDENGWKTYIHMTVADGKITKVDYNNVNKDGNLKTDDDEYQKRMKDKTGVGPQEYIPQLSQALVEHQNTESIDIVSGATHSSHTFKMYAAQLINAAQRGDTTPIEVDNFVYEKE